VDFRNAILIMTSNIASQYILEHAGDDPATLEARVDQELHRVFRPEFLNRLDETILFSALTREELLQIVDLQLQRIERTIVERGLRLVVEPAVRQRLAAEGYDPAYGARPLKRVLARRILDPLALGLLEGRFASGDTVEVVEDQAEVVLRRAEAPSTAGSGVE
jgi:ATP-dependent Clp protease ATP-binding subunit ClpB